MILPNLSDKITTYSDHALIGLANVVHFTCPMFEVVTSQITPQEKDVYRLMYIHKGSIQPPGERNLTSLSSGTVLLWNGEDNIRFRVTDSDLEAWIFYIHGAVLPYYKEVIYSTETIFVLHGATDDRKTLHPLIQLKQSKSLTEEILVNNLVTVLFSAWCREDSVKSTLPSAAPAYLLAIKEEFDRNYHLDFSLDDLASRHKVNKFRLCREFAKHFELSPIRYLNRIRIQNACFLLISTDMHVGEIAASVGIENVNHFIRLFRAQINMTPLEYRQKLL